MNPRFGSKRPKIVAAFLLPIERAQPAFCEGKSRGRLRFETWV